MANFHSRSNSFPSNSNPVMEDVEDHLHRLKLSSEATSTSTSSICANLASLGDLHESINDLIQMPSIQQVLCHGQGEKWMNELLEGSLGLVDLCEFSRDVVCSTKESVQDLESCIRRNRGETATADDINAYVASRKKINKRVEKCIKNLKSINQSSTAIPDNLYDLKAIGTMLKKTESLGFTVLKSVITLVAGARGRSKQRSWLLLSKLAQTSRVHSELESEYLCSLNIHKSKKAVDNVTLKQLKETEMSIKKLEEGLEAFFRSLIKTRVSILNVLSH